MTTANPSQWLQAHLASQPPRASSLMVTVLGDAVLPRGGRVWLGSLIQLLAPFGLNERLVRTTVFRLTKAGWLTAHNVGRRTDYALTALSRARFEQAARQVYARASTPWDHQWRIIFPRASLARADREALARSLYWQGFGAMPNGVYLHPTTNFDATFEALRADGLESSLGSLACFLARAVPHGPAPKEDQKSLIKAAWSLDALAQDYQIFLAQYEQLATVLTPPKAKLSLAGETAMMLRTLLIHDYRRLLLRDPDLPDALLPTHWPGHRARDTTARLYRQLLPPSEAQLNLSLILADKQNTQASKELQSRFRSAEA